MIKLSQRQITAALPAPLHSDPSRLCHSLGLVFLVSKCCANPFGGRRLREYAGRYLPLLDKREKKHGEF